VHYIVIGIGLIAVSFAAIFIRLAGEAPSMIIASYRIVLAVLIMSPYAYRKTRQQWSNYTPNTLKWNIISGVALAFHFATWIASLKYTSVASSVVLVTTNPLFVALFGWLFLDEKPRKLVLLGIAVSIAGTVVMTVGNYSPGESRLLGDMLALAGALFASIYLLTGRSLRQTISATSYSYIAYGTAAVVLVLITLIAGFPWTGYSTTTYSMFVLLAVVPQIIGHTSFNYALKYMPAAIVAIVILGEPIGASFLAWVLLGEPVHQSTFFGGGLILLGVFLAVYTQEQKR